MTDHTIIHHDPAASPGRSSRCKRGGGFGAPVRLLVFAALVPALALAGCESGTIGGTQLRCESASGLFAPGEVSCTGSAERAGGSVGLELVDTDDVRSGEYRLETVIAVESGAAEATVETASGGEAGGRVSPGDPLRLRATVEVDDDEDLAAALRVRGEEVRGLAHETRLAPR